MKSQDILKKTALWLSTNLEMNLKYKPPRKCARIVPARSLFCYHHFQCVQMHAGSLVQVYRIFWGPFFSETKMTSIAVAASHERAKKSQAIR